MRNQRIGVHAKTRQVHQTLLSSQTAIDVDLDEMYGRAMSELGLQQSKRDQIIASYLTVLSLATSVAMTSEHITNTMRGGFFLAAGIIGFLLAIIIIRYRVYKEAYWLCCQTISVLFGYRKEDLNKFVIQNVYRSTMLKKGKSYTKPVPKRIDDLQPTFCWTEAAPEDARDHCVFQLRDPDNVVLQQELGTSATFHATWGSPGEEQTLRYQVTIRYVDKNGKEQTQARDVKITFQKGKNGISATEKHGRKLKREPEVRFSKWTYVKKNCFSAETIYLFIQALICATVTSLGLSFLLGGARWPIALAVGVAVLVGLIREYFKQCIEVYGWLLTGDESAFNKAFGKAWLLHFYH